MRNPEAERCLEVFSGDPNMFERWSISLKHYARAQGWGPWVNYAIRATRPVIHRRLPKTAQAINIHLHYLIASRIPPGQGWGGQGRSSWKRRLWPESMFEVTGAQGDLRNEQQREKRSERREKREARSEQSEASTIKMRGCKEASVPDFLNEQLTD